MENQEKNKSEELEEFLIKNDSTDFYKEFNLSKEEIFQRPLNLKMNKTLTDKEKHLLIRQRILESELSDFTKLIGSAKTYLKKIDSINETVLNRFKIERRNTFSFKVETAYKDFLIASKNLRNIIEFKQIPFYKKRITILKSEIS